MGKEEKEMEFVGKKEENGKEFGEEKKNGNKFKKWNLNIAELALFRLACENRVPGFTIERAKEIIELNREGLGTGILQALNELIDAAEAKKESRLIAAAA